MIWICLFTSLSVIYLFIYYLFIHSFRRPQFRSYYPKDLKSRVYKYVFNVELSVLQTIDKCEALSLTLCEEGGLKGVAALRCYGNSSEFTRKEVIGG